MDETSVRQKMQSVLAVVTSDIASLRTGRASPSLVENIQVVVYGGQQKLKVQELATISATDSQTLVIDPFDKSIVGEIKKGLEMANLGLNPSQDGEIIRLTFPPLTSEDREKYTKLLSQKVESGRVMIRQIRGEAIKEIQKTFAEKNFGEDEKFRQEKQIQAITDEFIGKIEDMGERKKQELLQI